MLTVNSNKDRLVNGIERKNRAKDPSRSNLIAESRSEITQIRESVQKVVENIRFLLRINSSFKIFKLV